MYQIVGLINRFMYGSSQDAGSTVATWHVQGRYRGETESMEEENSESRSSNMDSNNNNEEPDFIPTNLKLVIILSGKRKSGKDHISTLITNYIGHERMPYLAILRIAGPIKKEFARNNRLDFTRLLDSSGYKENFRMAMVQWSEEYREKEGWNCFLKQAIKEQRAKDKAIWILNDARRPCDLEYFDNDPAFLHTKILKLRIEATDEARMSRGWKFIEGIDDRETECGLDSYEDWTHIIDNDYNDEKKLLAEFLRPVFDEIDAVFKKLENEYIEPDISQ